MSTSQQIYINQNFPGTLAKTLNLNNLTALLNNSYLTGNSFPFQVNSSTTLNLNVTSRHVLSPENFGPLTYYVGTINGNATKKFSMTFNEDRKLIQFYTDGPCYEIVSPPFEAKVVFTNNEVVFLKEVPCYQTPDNNSPSLQCDFYYIPVKIIIRSKFRDFYPSDLDAAESAKNMLSLAMKIINKPFMIRNKYIDLTNMLFGFPNAVYFENDNNNKLLECIPSDLTIYFDGGSSNSYFQRGSVDCNQLEKDNRIYFYHTKGNDESFITLAHEIGHFLGAGHTDDYAECKANDCCDNPVDPDNNYYLMCHQGPATRNPEKILLEDPYTWTSIVSNLNAQSCLCTQKNPPQCPGCYEGHINFSKDYVVGACDKNSEYTITFSLQNDCISRSNQKIWLSFPNGNGTNLPKVDLQNNNDFGDFISKSTQGAQDVLESASFDLAPNELKHFSVNVKLVSAPLPPGTQSCNFEGMISSNISINTLNLNSPTYHASLKYLTTTIVNNRNLTFLLTNFPGCFVANTNCALKNLGAFRIQNSFTVNQSHCFGDTKIFLDANAKIIVPQGINLSLDNCDISGCQDFWESIILEDGANLVINNCRISGATWTIWKKGAGNIEIKGNTKMSNCVNGVFGSEEQGNSIIKIEDSEFSDFLYNGIKTKSSDLTVKNCTFSNMKSAIVAEQSNVHQSGNKYYQIGEIGSGIANWGFPHQGNAITFIGDPNNILEPVPGYSGRKNEFYGCNVAYAIKYGKYNLENSTMADLATGVYIENTNSSGNLIKKFDIKALKYGIFAKDNGAMNANFEDNTISINDPSGKGIYVGLNSGNLTIKKNTITNKGGVAGVHVNTSSNVVIDKNTITSESGNGNHTNCIFIENSINTVAMCNALASPAFGQGTTVLETHDAINNSFRCNTLDGADCGLIFNGYCKPTSMAENTLSNHAQIGFGIATIANGTEGIIGDQTFIGNHLTSCSNITDAWNYGVPSVVGESKVLVTPLSPYLPNNINDLINLGFFLPPTSGNEANCSNMNICPGGIGARTTSSKNYLSVISTSLLDGYQSGEFINSRINTSIVNSLLYILENNIEDQESQLWLNNNLNTKYYAFARVIHNLKNIKFVNSSQENLSNIKDKNYSILNKVIPENENDKLIIEVLKMKIDQLIDSNSIAKNQNRLNEIALMCAYESGIAGYISREMLEGITHIDLNDIESCGKRSDIRLYVPKKSSFEIYPNPSTNTLFVHFSDSRTEKVNYEIIAISGSRMKTGYFYNNSYLNIQDLPNGIYLIKDLDHNIQKSFIKQN